MKTEEVKKLSPLNRFIYWIRERHQIHLRRKAGKPKPWTDDEVLQTVFFTNPYRENDKTTVWFRENVREPLRNSPEVLMATVIFRWFNYIPTGKFLMGIHDVGKKERYGMLTNWDRKSAVECLGAHRDSGNQIFTGAFMINSPGGEPKLEAIIRRVSKVWDDRERILHCLTTDEFSTGSKCSMETAHKVLTQYEGLGGFMAYEIICDLRYTYLLEHAGDKMTWCNPGPGCIRGLYRVAGEDFPKGNNSSSPPRPKDWKSRMEFLLYYVTTRLPKMPPFEMREIEHSLCEFDKAERVLWGDGRAKRTYSGK